MITKFSLKPGGNKNKQWTRSTPLKGMLKSSFWWNFGFWHSLNHMIWIIIPKQLNLQIIINRKFYWLIGDWIKEFPPLTSSFFFFFLGSWLAYLMSRSHGSHFDVRMETCSKTHAVMQCVLTYMSSTIPRQANLFCRWKKIMNLCKQNK